MDMTGREKGPFRPTDRSKNAAAHKILRNSGDYASGQIRGSLRDKESQRNCTVSNRPSTAGRPRIRPDNQRCSGLKSITPLPRLPLIFVARKGPRMCIRSDTTQETRPPKHPVHKPLRLGRRSRPRLRRDSQGLAWGWRHLHE